jgi:uncharacterized protein
VTFPAFKAGDAFHSGTGGGFDFHTPPPQIILCVPAPGETFRLSLVLILNTRASLTPPKDATRMRVKHAGALVPQQFLECHENSMQNGTLDSTTHRPLLAAIFHTFVVSIVILSLVPTVNLLRDLLNWRRPPELSEALLVALLVQWSLASLVWCGTAARGHGLHELLGRTWENVRDAQNDFRFACVVILFMLISAFSMRLLGPFDNSSIDTSPRTLIQLILSVCVAISAGITEELIFRGYLLRQFEALTGSENFGLLSQAVLFSLAHGSQQTVAGILHKFLAGYFLGWSAIRRKSLLPGIIAHSLLNVLMTILVYLLPRGK